MLSVETWLNQILPSRPLPSAEMASAYAPSNIALCKYWGKRPSEFNLPLTSSLSISLAHKGTTTILSVIEAEEDLAVLNGEVVAKTHPFYRRVTGFLDFFRPRNYAFKIITDSQVPIAQGLASSASGFAALTLALDGLFGWQLPLKTLSMIARIGSGSACRSLWHGFVLWQAGSAEDGSDSFAEPLEASWPELRVGLLVHSHQAKAVSSREGMIHTQSTSPFFSAWPALVNADLASLEKSIADKNFTLLGSTAEANAEAMHALMQTARPALVYSTPETLRLKEAVWALRKTGLEIYFTQDAGPNLKLLFLRENTHHVVAAFPEVEIIDPFSL